MWRGNFVNRLQRTKLTRAHRLGQRQRSPLFGSHKLKRYNVNVHVQSICCLSIYFGWLCWQTTWKLFLNDFSQFVRTMTRWTLLRAVWLGSTKGCCCCVRMSSTRWDIHPRTVLYAFVLNRTGTASQTVFVEFNKNNAGIKEWIIRYVKSTRVYRPCIYAFVYLERRPHEAYCSALSMLGSSCEVLLPMNCSGHNTKIFIYLWTE